MDTLQDLDLNECRDCGATIAPATDRTYTLDEDDVLCFQCAVRRGGVYEESRERWVVPPNLSGIPYDDRHAEP